MTTPQWSLGIDFGTSNTAAAHTNAIKGNVETVNLAHGRNTMSSSVYMENPDAVDTGDVALAKAENNPQGFIPAPKRLIPQQIFQLGGMDVPSAVPVAAVLQSVLKKASREHGGTHPGHLVLTHPEAWSDAEIKVLLEAAESLGLGAENITTVSEPQAAAHYYSAANKLEAGQKIGVFDFGGGTLDIAVLEAQGDGSFNVIAARGSNAIGGKTFDALLRKWVDRHLEDNHPDLMQYLRRHASLSERYALEDSIRRAKELLSESASATISIVTDKFDTERLQITRGEFEELIAPVLEQATTLTRATLTDAGIDHNNPLVALYLTGGSSRIPMVQEQLKDLGPIATLDDPKTVVAQGALAAAQGVLRAVAINTGEKTQTPHTPPPPNTPAAEQTQQLPQVPETPPAKQRATKANKSTKTPLLIGAAVLVAALVGGGVFFANQSSDSSSTNAAATTTTQPAQQPETTAAAPVKNTDAAEAQDNASSDASAQLRKQFIDKVPAGITVDEPSCNYSEGGLETSLNCYVNVPNQNEYAESSLSMKIVIDERMVKVTAQQIRDGKTGPISPKVKPLIIDTGNPKVFAVAQESLSNFELCFANVSEDVAGCVRGFKTQQSAEAFGRDYKIF
ncbi:Hsp70 family protein [Corynebacterium aquilae]|uniref:Hsp70 family protein n=1 Tax=Corynebacterium aquilae TaxID=203263 RepID=UPI0009518AB9|nr:Hsp70 family protein [Corynebacterium aquilae]